MMKRAIHIGTALLAAFVLVAVSASIAQAEEKAPYWSIGGTRLVAGKTHNLISHGIKPFVLTNSLKTSTFECSSLVTEKGVLLGSNAGNPGTNNEIVKFSGCVNPRGSNGANCHLAPSEGSTEQ